MTCKKISVQLDSVTTKILNELVTKNSCTISDVVNIAIVSLNNSSLEVTPANKLLTLLKKKVVNSKWRTIENWCLERTIEKHKLLYLLRQGNKKKTIYGFGNIQNRSRDRADDRCFKTHTAWIAHCLEQDFDICLF